MIEEETEAQGKKQMGSPPPSLEESIPNQESGFCWSPGSGLCHKRTLGGAGQKAGMVGVLERKMKEIAQQLCGCA